MAWYVSVFLAVVGLCALLYLCGLCRGIFSKTRKCTAVVVKRYTEEFPFTMALRRNNRKERYLQFRTEEGKTLTLAVREDLYAQCPTGTKGELWWRGSILVDFQVQ